MAESRREKKIPATFHFFALAALPVLRSPVPWFGAMPAPGLGPCRLLAWVDDGPWFQGIAGPLVSGRCRPLDRGDAGPWFQGIHPNCFEIQD